MVNKADSHMPEDDGDLWEMRQSLAVYERVGAEYEAIA